MITLRIHGDTHELDANWDEVTVVEAPAHNGLSVIASPQGHVIDSVYDAELEDRVLMGQVPIVRTHAMNSHVRPYLPFDAGALLVGLLVIAWRQQAS